MSDLVQFVLDTFPGSKVVETSAVPAPRASRARQKSLDCSNEDSKRKTKEKREKPYVLASLCNNLLKGCNQAEMLKNGYLSESDIVQEFRKMCMKASGKRSPLMINESGELMTFPVKSRWNSDYNYGIAVGRKALDEVKGLRKVSHLVLTIDAKRLYEFIPDWWVYGDE